MTDKPLILGLGLAGLFLSHFLERAGGTAENIILGIIHDVLLFDNSAGTYIWHAKVGAEEVDVRNASVLSLIFLPRMALLHPSKTFKVDSKGEIGGGGTQNADRCCCHLFSELLVTLDSYDDMRRCFVHLVPHSDALDDSDLLWPYLVITDLEDKPREYMSTKTLSTTRTHKVNF